MTTHAAALRSTRTYRSQGSFTSKSLAIFANSTSTAGASSHRATGSTTSTNSRLNCTGPDICAFCAAVGSPAERLRACVGRFGFVDLADFDEARDRLRLLSAAGAAAAAAAGAGAGAAMVGSRLHMNDRSVFGLLF